MKSFRCCEIKQLAHELTMSPARHRPRQLSGILQAIDLIEPDRDYPYAFVCFHVTGYRPRRSEDSLLSGKDLIADLVELMDVLTASNPQPVDASNGLLYDAEALAERFNVSTKTISRWRQRGLAGAWYVLPDDKPRLAFTAQAVEQFVARNLELVRRGTAFRVMSDAEKADIIERARVLVARERCSLHAVTQVIAGQTGRAIETIRYTLRRFDRDHPEEALFDRAEQPREIDEATLVLETFESGAVLRDLCRRFDRREPEIHRLVVRGRALRLAESPIAYIHNPAFDEPDAEERIIGECTAESSCTRATVDRSGTRARGEPDEILKRTPSDLPPYLQALYRTPLLSREEELRLFAQMNFTLHQAEALRQKLVKKIDAASEAAVAAVEAKLDDAARIRNRIIQANLRLVVSIAKRHLFGHPMLNLFELVSDGNMALMRAVDKFDYGRGFRFSTYATWAITRALARSVPDEITHADRFQTGCEELLATTGQADAHEPGHEDAAAVAKDAITRTLRLLDERERVIVERHFGLGAAASGRTLDEIGRELGISKERVRQIELKALAKLRAGLGEHGVELLAG